MYNIISYIVITVFNWSNFTTDFNEFWLQGYKQYLGDLFWPVIFVGVFGMIFVVSRDIIATTAAILFTFGVFGTSEVFTGNPEFSLMFSILAIAGFAGAVLMLFTKRKPGG